jgi:hypothetical protein
MEHSTNANTAEYKRRFAIAHQTARWAVTMTQVAIRRAVADKPYPRWHFIKFDGKSGGESRGVVDLIAIRKDHSEPADGTKRGDALQIILVQVKGGRAPKPTAEDAARLRIVAKRHRVCGVLLATWTKGREARFYSLHKGYPEWREVEHLRTVFG